MPPKASKRKVDVESDAEISSHSESEQAKKPAAKKSKAKEPVKPLDASLPHNTAFPQDLQPFPAKAEGAVRLSAWNVCGIKACDKKVRSLLSRRAIFRADLVSFSHARVSARISRPRMQTSSFSPRPSRSTRRSRSSTTATRCAEVDLRLQSQEQATDDVSTSSIVTGAQTRRRATLELPYSPSSSP